jgi:Carboxypeptidase regulatory-like domain
VRSVALPALLLLALPVTGQGQRHSTQLGTPIAWQVFNSIDSTTIGGVAVYSDGTPLSDLTVRVVDTALRTTTDSNGRFHLRLPAGGEWVVAIEAFGIPPYGPKELFVEILAPNESHVTLAAVIPDGPALCSSLCIGTWCQDLSLQVSDSLSGRSLAATATLRLEHPDGTIEKEVQLGDRSEWVGLGENVATSGFHNIELQVPGYRTWRADNVWLEPISRCHGELIGRSHRVRLVPIGSG